MRGSRIYQLCGARSATEKRRGGMWLPGAAVLAFVAFSLYALVHPVESPDSVQHRLPLVQVAHYTAEDFFSAAR